MNLEGWIRPWSYMVKENRWFEGDQGTSGMLEADNKALRGRPIYYELRYIDDLATAGTSNELSTGRLV